MADRSIIGKKEGAGLLKSTAIFLWEVRFDGPIR